ncbi:MAG: ATP-binding cassette domain-containing protein [Vicinamibacterales bacterium]
MAGAMDRPTSGRLVLEGQDLAALADDALTRLRRERIGFVFQFFNLLPTLTLGDNIALPCLLGGMAGAEADRRAAALADRVGIGHRLRHYPQEVSGGEMQRAAIARALVHEPALLIADEPTGNLDTATSHEVMEIFARLRRERGLTIVVITHERDIAAYGSRTIDFRDGVVMADVIHDEALAQPSSR